MVLTENCYTSFITLQNPGYSVEREEFSLGDGVDRIFVKKVAPFRKVYKNVVLFVHGLTFPSEADFDLPLKGHSFAHYFAQRGLDCYLFDIRGYGKSAAPKSVSMKDRVEDLYRVYKHILSQEGVDSISFIGVSSGCNIIADFLQNYNVDARDVTLLGPCYLRNEFLSRNIEKLQLLKIAKLLQGKFKDPYVSFKRKALRKRIIEGEESRLNIAAASMFIETSIAADSCEGDRLTSPILPFFDECKKHDFMERLFKTEGLKAPTFIIRGEEDEICCKKAAIALYKDLQGRGVHTEIFTQEESKHDMHLYKNAEGLFSRMFAFLMQKREV